MHIEVDYDRWDGGQLLRSFPAGPTLLEEDTTVPFSLEHLIGVFEAALKAHHQRARAPTLWDRLQCALGRTPRISLKGQYIRAAFFFTGRPLNEPLQSWAYYKVHVGDCAVLLKDLRERANQIARKRQQTDPSPAHA